MSFEVEEISNYFGKNYLNNDNLFTIAKLGNKKYLVNEKSTSRLKIYCSKTKKK